MLEVRDLEILGAPQLAGVSLSASPGEVIALVGPGGSGKTAILRTIAGLASPSAGSIDWHGERIDGLGPAEVARRGIRLIPASGAVVSGLSVVENLRLGGLRLRSRAWRRELDWVTGLFPGLGDRLADPAGRLGAAEQRILAIGRALLARPRLLLVDGVRAGGVSPGVGAQLLELVSALAGKGLAVVIADRRAASVPVAGRRVELPGRAVRAQGIDRASLEEPVDHRSEEDRFFDPYEIDLSDLSGAELPDNHRLDNPDRPGRSIVEPRRSNTDGGSQ